MNYGKIMWSKNGDSELAKIKIMAQLYYKYGTWYQTISRIGIWIEESPACGSVFTNASCRVCGFACESVEIFYRRTIWGHWEQWPFIFGVDVWK